MEDDIFYAFMPMHQVCKWSGLAPFTIVRGEKESHVKITKGDVCLFILFISGLVTLFYFTYSEHFTGVEKDDFLEYYVGTFELLITSLIAAGGLFCGLVQYKIIFSIYSKIANINNELLTLSTPVKSRTIRRYCWIIIGVRMMLVIIINLYDIFSWLSDTGWTSTVHYFVTAFIDMLIMSQITILLNTLRLQVIQINKKVEELVTKTLTSSKQKQLRKLVRLHDEVCDVCEDLNSTFHFYLVVKHIIIFASLVYTAFFVTYVIQIYQFMAKRMLDVVFWMGDNVKEIVLLVISCELLTLEMGKIIKILIDTRAKRKEIKDEVIMNVLRVTRRKLKITAFHFFPIDLTVLYSIIAGVTTYFVYLLQFSSIQNNN